MHRPIVAVFGSSGTKPGDPDWEDGVRCGELLVRAGLDVATGGYGGLMEAVSAGAAAAGGRVIGVTAPGVFPDRTGANRYVTEELHAASITERIHELVNVTDGAIALNGSIGTLTELVAAWNLAFVARFSGSTQKPVVAVGPRWDRLVADLARELETDAALVTCVATVEEAVDAVAVRLRK